MENERNLSLVMQDIASSLNSGDVDNALTHIDEVLGRDLSEHENGSDLRGIFSFYKGELLKGLKQYKEAISCLESAMKFAKDRYDNVSTHNSLGFLFFSIGNYSKCLEHSLITIEMQSDFPFGYSSAGASYKELGEYDKAIEYLNKSINFKEDCWRYVCLGMVYIESKNYLFAFVNFIQSYKTRLDCSLNCDYSKNNYLNLGSSDARFLEKQLQIPQNMIKENVTFLRILELWNKKEKLFENIFERKFDIFNSSKCIGGVLEELIEKIMNIKGQQKSNETIILDFQKTYEIFVFGRKMNLCCDFSDVVIKTLI